MTGVLEMVIAEDLPLDRVGRPLCEDLEAVRDDLLTLIVETGRRLEQPHDSYALDRPGESGFLGGLIAALGLVLDVDEAAARREALRKIAADRVRRAA